MLKVGIVGTGGISQAHGAAWAQVPEARLAAACDIRPGKAEDFARKTGAKVYLDLEEMLEKEPLDILDICLPTYLHADTAVRALQKGIHVLTEKPVSLRREDVRRVYEAAAQAGVRVMVAQVLRDNVREGDVVGRVGGEEFLVLLPGADDGAAWAAAERVQRGLRQAAISLRMGAYDSPLECTASIGLAIANLPAAASAPMQEGRLRTLIDRADKVLYQAKNDGRNRIEVVHV